MKVRYQKKIMWLYVCVDLAKLCIHSLCGKQGLEKIQNKNVKKMMKYCYQIPFYRKKFEQVNMTPDDFRTADDLYGFPLTTKDELRRWYREETTRNPEIKKYWMWDATSGSTGKPMEVYYHPKDRAMNIAIWMHAAVINGVHPIFDVTARVSNPATISMKKKKHRKRFFQIYSLAFTKTAKEMVSFYNLVKPDFFYSNRSKLVQMALYAKKNGVSLHRAKACASAAEKMDRQSLKLIKEQFGDVLYDTYGCTETGMLAYQKKGYNDRYVIRMDTHVLHVLDADGKKAEKGRAIITSLYHFGFPIINYDVGDGVDTFVDRQSGIRYIRSINGRMNDWIVFADGNRINYQEIYAVMSGKFFLQQYRVIQKDYAHLHILLAKMCDVTVDEQREETLIEKALRKLIPYDLTYTFEWVDEILPDANGKLRSIISEVKR